MSASLIVNGVLGAPVNIDATTVASHNQTLTDTAKTLWDIIEAMQSPPSGLVDARDAHCTALRAMRTALHMPVAEPTSPGGSKPA